MSACEPTITEDIDWDTLAHTQVDVIERATSGTEDGLVFALMDRNSTSQIRCRPVLVRVHPREGKVHVFDHLGRIIDEPDDGVINGVQDFQVFAHELKSWDPNEPNGGNCWFYRIPELRPKPRDRSCLPNDGSPAKKSRAVSI